MRSIRHLRPADYRIMPWKNGLGTTTEIAVHPEGAGVEAFTWRVSAADLAASGPFSTFAGIDRTIVLIEGAPMTLSHEGLGEHRLRPLVPHRFSGEVFTFGTLESPARDFNVMVRRDRVCAEVRVHDLAERACVEDEAETLMVHVLRGRVSIEASGETSHLAGNETLLVTGAGRASVAAVEAGAVVIVVAIRPIEAVSRERALVESAVLLAEEAEPRLTGAEQAAWLDRLESSLPELTSAADAALADPEGVEPALRLVGALARFFWVRGHTALGRAIAEKALAREGGSVAARAKALSGAGALAYAQADFRAARALHAQSLSLWEGLFDVSGAARAHDALGLVAREQGALEEARDLHTMAFEEHRSREDGWGMVSALANLGVVARMTGHLEEAEAKHREALALRRTLGDALGTASSLANLGVLARLGGRLDDARALLEECLSIRKGLGDRWGVAGAFGSLGVVARAAGDLDAAKAYHEQALGLARELGDGLGIAESMEGLAAVAKARGDAPLAQRWIDDAHAQRARIGAGPGEDG